ncbi:DUF4822 domain-containing protein [Chryseobacterium sp. JUb7]|uniref:DUF4822 domain-containing protein n=1 Tax=Chryseobacterium sp. JUb7 TaxID=2940599 RepID=UPI002169509C|nr:DUF4822 domain-containing protein [Chryseobacterium sp. JUb7]MCS3532822.1 hypothetical protein [Chryseobacterium sp. JUb7]
MNTLKKLCYLFAAFTLSASFVSCSNDDDQVTAEEQLTPSQVLSSTPWATTGAKDKNGNNVALNDPAVAGFVGFAYFNSDGNFAIYGLNDVLRSIGTWSVDPQGKTRTITALRPDGTTIFTRDVDILELSKKVFTYRIHTNPSDPSVFYDIIHERVNHTEPENGQRTLASTAWETTDALDNTGAHVNLNDPAVNGFVGYAYFRAGGAYAIYGLNNVLRNQGDWSISPDGKTRNLIARDPSTGAQLWTRDVNILELNDTKFTYRIVPNAANPSVYYDIVHQPVDHIEP